MGAFILYLGQLSNRCDHTCSGHSSLMGVFVCFGQFTGGCVCTMFWTALRWVCLYNVLDSSQMGVSVQCFGQVSDGGVCTMFWIDLKWVCLYNVLGSSQMGAFVRYLGQLSDGCVCTMFRTALQWVRSVATGHG